MYRYFSSTGLYFALLASDPCLVYIWNPKSHSSNHILQKPSESDLDIHNQMCALDRMCYLPAHPGDIKHRRQIWRFLKVLLNGWFPH